MFRFPIIGNSLIVWIVYKYRRLRTSPNYLIANMVVSDLVSAVVGTVVGIPYNDDGKWLIGGVFGNILCKITAYLLEVSFPVSLFSCVVITIDRYYAVDYPMKKALRKIKYTIAGIWFISGLMNTGYLFWWKIDMARKVTILSPR